MAEAAWLLPDFVSFLDERGQTTVTIQAALAWVRLREDEVVTTVSPRRITAVRGFAHYLSGIDSDTEIPPMGLVPHRQRWRPPFLYSDADITALLTASDAIQPPFRAATYRTCSVCWPPPACASARRSASTATTSTGRKACY
ncbi:hypothetical protein GCM10010532_092600 [Dactylosporangium siamense]|uniref:Core-binding (CB) domain-containing protein n=2 Tax=Dactylosporangium siamense TaxID=685454 RepID=A0A919UCE9_9ACTN|nr:hypothetical protein Dsi01nite_084350 [Dactylosporangium siamense]